MGSQDLQLPPAFALPQDESISRAVELAYERDFDYIPCVLTFGRRDNRTIAHAAFQSPEQESQTHRLSQRRLSQRKMGGWPG